MNMENTGRILTGAGHSFVQRLCRSVYDSSDQPIPSAILSVQSFRQQVGYTAFNRDKWLARITVDSTLEAFSGSFDLVVPALKKKNSVDESATICRLLMLAGTRDEALLNKELMLIARFGMSPVLEQAVDYFLEGRVILEATTLDSILKVEPKLLDKCLKDPLSEPFVDLCSSNMSLYRNMCTALHAMGPGKLPEFVHRVLLTGKVSQLYPESMQPCVLLCLVPELGDTDLAKSHIGKLIKELSRLWSVDPAAVIELLDHFPRTAHLLLASCHRSAIARNFCIQLIHNN